MSDTKTNSSEFRKQELTNWLIRNFLFFFSELPFHYFNGVFWRTRVLNVFIFGRSACRILAPRLGLKLHRTGRVEFYPLGHKTRPQIFYIFGFKSIGVSVWLWGLFT